MLPRLTSPIVTLLSGEARFWSGFPVGGTIDLSAGLGNEGFDLPMIGLPVASRGGFRSTLAERFNPLGDLLRSEAEKTMNLKGGDTTLGRPGVERGGLDLELPSYILNGQKHGAHFPATVLGLEPPWRSLLAYAQSSQGHRKRKGR